MARIAGLPDLCRFVRRSESVKVYNTVQLVIGKEMIEVSGCVMSQRSEILEDLVGKQFEIYLDQFVGEKDGIQDCVEMLYGGTVMINTLNIRTMLKFSVIYQILDMYKLCIDWIKGHISIENLFSMIELGILVDDLDHDKHDLLDLCKKDIMENVKDNLFKLSQSWSFSNNISFIKFLIQKDILYFTLPILTSWVSNDSHIRVILDEIVQRDLTQELFKHGSRTNHLITKMNDKMEVVETSKKLHKLQINIFTSVGSPCSSKGLVSSHKDLSTLLSKDYNTFSAKKILKLEKEYGLEHFQFVDIAFDWIIINEPYQKSVINLLCSNVRECELNYLYLVHVRNALYWNFEHPVLFGRVELAEYQYSDSFSTIYDLSDLTDNTDKVLYCDKCKNKFTAKLRLEDKCPCYVLDDDPYCMHQVKHWYIYIDIDDNYGTNRYYLSFITNNYSTVIEKVKRCLAAGYDMRLYCMYKCI